MEISVIEVTDEPVETLVEEKSAGKCESFFMRFIPSKATVSHAVTQLVCFLLLFGTLWGILECHALPGSEVFALLLLVLCCHVGGVLLSLIRLPPLLGMLIAGFLFRNLPFITFYEDIPVKMASMLRSSALVVILLRAGMSLDPYVLKRLSLVCMRLAFLPCSVEAVAAGLLARFLLGLPWALSFSLGFIISAVSPAVVIPSMLLLEEKCLGQDKGMTTLIVAATSVENVYAITAFGVSIGIAFAKGSLIWTLIKGPLEVFVGLAYGGVIGVLCWYLPHKTEENKVFYRVVFLTLGGLSAAFVSQQMDFSAAGALACVAVAFIATLKWREEEDRNIPVANIEAGLWSIMQVFLFGLIGAEVSIHDVQRDIGFGLAILFAGLFFRMIVAYLCVLRSGLNLKEQVFVPFAWLPKATVQAALGSVVLDLARALNYEPEFIVFGKQILTIAVLSILFAAPIGAVAIDILGPICLHKSEPSETRKSLDKAKDPPASYGSCNVSEGKDTATASDAPLA